MKILLILCLLVGGVVSLAPLYKQKDAVPERYIVKIKNDGNLNIVINRVHSSAVWDKRIHVHRTFTNVFKGFAASLTENLLSSIRNFDDVEYVEEDAIVRIAEVSSWGLDRIDELNLMFDRDYSPIGHGAGINVYVLDTGINVLHEDFEGRAEIAFDILGGNGLDCNGHGTHCAGTVAGATYGVAKEVTVHGVRCFDCSGEALTTDVIDACDWVTINAVQPAVALMSFGGNDVSYSMDSAVQRIIDSGIQVAISAGNENTNACNRSPARLSSAITVGATDTDDSRAYFSNYGYCVDIFAPGVSIPSAWDDSSTASKTTSGTSISAAHVAGAAAILLSQDSSLNPAHLKEYLQVKANIGLITDLEIGSPNLLLYIGEGSGGGEVPPPRPQATECGSIISTDGSGIYSPRFPADYSDNQFCEYYVQAPEGKVVELSFQLMDLDRGSTVCFDLVRAFDGDSPNDIWIATFCGWTIPEPVYSTGNKMYIEFKSDWMTTANGFAATVTFKEPSAVPTSSTPTTGCGSVHTEPTGTIATPNYPNDYPNLADCETRIVSYDRNARVTLTFDKFNTELSGNCRYDYLLIYDGADSSFPFLDRFCGSVVPAPITSTGPDLYLLFKSDSTVADSGILANYTIA